MLLKYDAGRGRRFNEDGEIYERGETLEVDAHRGAELLKRMPRAFTAVHEIEPDTTPTVSGETADTVAPGLDSKDLEALNRDALNELALAEGVESPEKLHTKADVIAALTPGD